MSEVVETLGLHTPHVGAFIREEILDELGLTVQKAAEIMGVRRATLSDLLNEKSSLSPEMALRVEKAFGVKMDLLLKMQAGQEAEAMRRNADAVKVERYVAPSA